MQKAHPPERANLRTWIFFTKVWFRLFQIPQIGAINLVCALRIRLDRRAYLSLSGRVCEIITRENRKVRCHTKDAPMNRTGEYSLRFGSGYK